MWADVIIFCINYIMFSAYAEAPAGFAFRHQSEDCDETRDSIFSAFYLVEHAKAWTTMPPL